MTQPAYEKDFPLIFNEQYGLWLREGSTDKECCKDVWKDYEAITPYLSGHSVMDLGSCFGAAAKWAKDHGAGEVYCYEPEPKNFPLLLRNIVGLKFVYPLAAAVVEHDQSEINLYRGGRRGRSMESASPLEIKGREAIVVMATNFWWELKHKKPDIVKMDIEGGEYALLGEKPLPEHVVGLVVEYHFKRKGMKEATAKINDFLMKEQGFTALEEPYLEDKNRHGMGIYVR